MTIVILSTLRMSTSGLAPWLSMMSRFWISVDSLKRPPTLLTIPSSFNSSCIVSSPSRLIRLLRKRPRQDAVKLPDRPLQIVVGDHMLIVARPFQLVLGRLQPAGERLRRLAVADLQALLVHLPARQRDEDRHKIVVH